jgi:raffinose/stachyose/melibiose transport system substrate-binding protein
MRFQPISRRTALKGAAALPLLGLAGSAGARRAGAQSETTLTVWDNWTRDVDNQMLESLNKKFEEAHPGLKIVRTNKSFDDLKATAKLALSSDDGPDVVQINQGLSDMGAMVKAGILTDLTPIAEKYGWNKILPPSMAARNRFSADGKLFGQGNLYGMPITAEFIGVYYNKEKAANLGDLPKTFDAFEASLKAAKDAEEVPIQFGDLDGWPAIHTYGEIQHEYVTKGYLDDFIYGRNDVSFVIPENQDAAAKLQDWVKAGYFTPDFSGIGYDDSWQGFEGGKGVYLITGSWISGELKAAGADGKFGFFLMPPLAEDKPNLHVAGTGMAYAIRKTSPQQELAADYINFLVSPEAADVLATTGIIPLAVDPAKVEAGTLYADIVAAWQHILSTDTAGHYLDWASPTFYDTIVAGLTDLMGLNITPEEFVQQMQDDYGAFIEGQAAS